MLYSAMIPPRSRRKMTRVLFLQLRLLKWATKERELSEEKCRLWLSGIREYQSRADRIAKWLWHATNRHLFLEEFAQGGNEDDKTAWVNELVADTILFFRRSNTSLHPFPHQYAQVWQVKAANWLKGFYEQFRSVNFPSYLFGEELGQRFDAQYYLREFRAVNGRLCICPACEEHKFYSTGSNEMIRAYIDHYLPQDDYPHLACHPFNLIPICSICNSGFKGTKDPLQREGSRWSLLDIWLPYRNKGLSTCTSLSVSLPHTIESVEFGDIIPLEGYHISAHIQVHNYLFDIPGRWGKSSDEIGERVFEKLINYREVHHEISDNVADLAEGLANTMVRDGARIPNSYSMTWWLRALADDVRVNGSESLVLQEMERIAESY
jgi:hypothetical protein